MSNLMSQYRINFCIKLEIRICNTRAYVQTRAFLSQNSLNSHHFARHTATSCGLFLRQCHWPPYGFLNKRKIWNKSAPKQRYAFAPVHQDSYGLIWSLRIDIINMCLCSSTPFMARACTTTHDFASLRYTNLRMPKVCERNRHRRHICCATQHIWQKTKIIWICALVFSDIVCIYRVIAPSLSSPLSFAQTRHVWQRTHWTHHTQVRTFRQLLSKNHTASFAPPAAPLSFLHNRCVYANNTQRTILAPYRQKSYEFMQPLHHRHRHRVSLRKRSIYARNACLSQKQPHACAPFRSQPFGFIQVVATVLLPHSVLRKRAMCGRNAATTLWAHAILL